MSKKGTKVASIGRLPEEMQAYILSKLDAQTAIIAKRVCRLWRDLICGMENCMHFWLRKCLKEIPAHSLVELSKLMYIASRRETTLAELGIDWRSNCTGKVPWMYWREVYAEYYRCRYIVNGTYKKTELHFFPLYGDVTCLHMQDNDIFSGHESGVVMCWSDIEGELSSEILYRHDRRVTCLAGIDHVSTVHSIVNGICDINIVSSSKDSTLIVYHLGQDTESSSTIKHFTKTVNCVRSWGSKFVAAADKSTIQGQPIWSSPDSGNATEGKLVTLFSPSVTNMKAVAFWENMVVSGDETGNLYHWSEGSACKKCNVKSQDMMTYITNLGSSVRTLYIIGTRVLAFTEDKQLHIGGRNIAEDHNFVSLNIYDAIHNTPECIAVRGSIFAMGCKGGSVFLYHLPEDNCWDSLNLSHPSQVIKTSCDHVNAIAIGDDGGGPVIAIATSGYCIHVVQFRQKKQHAENPRKSS